MPKLSVPTEPRFRGAKVKVKRIAEGVSAFEEHPLSIREEMAEVACDVTGDAYNRIWFGNGCSMARCHKGAA